MAGYRRSNPNKSKLIARKAHLKKSYRLTLADYERMLDEQAGVCAICSESCATGQRLAVDHDHTTGKARGLLCRRCNTKLESLENLEWRRKAEQYLSQN